MNATRTPKGWRVQQPNCCDRQDEDKSLNELMYKDNCHQDFKQKINAVPFNSPFHAICFICNQAKKIFFKFADFYIYPEKMIVHDKFLRPFADSTQLLKRYDNMSFYEWGNNNH